MKVLSVLIHFVMFKWDKHTFILYPSSRVGLRSAEEGEKRENGEALSRLNIDPTAAQL